MTAWAELDNIMLCEMSHPKKYNKCSNIYADPDPKGIDHILGGRRLGGQEDDGKTALQEDKV